MGIVKDRHRNKLAENRGKSIEAIPQAAGFWQKLKMLLILAVEADNAFATAELMR